MRNKHFLILLTFFLFILSGCQHNEVQEDDLIVTEGYIDIHISGNSQDNLQLDESERFSTYPAGKEYQYSGVSEVGNYLHFSIGRQNDMTGSSFLSMMFDYGDSTAKNITAALIFQKSIDSNTELQFAAETGRNIVSSDIVVDKYDPSTGILVGSYTFLVSNPDGKGNTRNAMVTGEFYVTVKKIIY